MALQLSPYKEYRFVKGIRRDRAELAFPRSPGLGCEDGVVAKLFWKPETPVIVVVELLS